MKKFLNTPRNLEKLPDADAAAPDRSPQPPRITVFEYGPDRPAVEHSPESWDMLFPIRADQGITWINFVGLDRFADLEAFGDRLGIHPLVVEDIVNTNQRPKYQDMDSYLFIEMNMLYWDETEKEIISEQVSIVLGEHYVVTFQESERDVFDPVRRRLREGKTRLSRLGPDYLAYALIDTIVDEYFYVLEFVGEQIEDLEEDVLTPEGAETVNSIHDMKRELIFMRKSVWPLREVIGALERGDSPFFKPSTLIYLRDIYDHTIQIIDSVETFRDVVSGIMDIYLTSVSNRMNEVMKVLTIIATIFIPLTFITGFFGMNFFEPVVRFSEWTGKGVFILVLLSVIAVPVAMLIWMRRMRWF